MIWSSVEPRKDWSTATSKTIPDGQWRDGKQCGVLGRVRAGIFGEKEPSKSGTGYIKWLAKKNAVPFAVDLLEVLLLIRMKTLELRLGSAASATRGLCG
jgi:hypothetical protein